MLLVMFRSLSHNNISQKKNDSTLTAPSIKKPAKNTYYNWVQFVPYAALILNV